MTEPTITQADKAVTAEILGYRDWDDATDYRNRGQMDAERDRVLSIVTCAREGAVAELRAALRTAKDALVRHHQWHAAQTTPDAEFGFIPADEYADSDMYEETVAALALANPLLADGPVNSAALSQKDTSHDA